MRLRYIVMLIPVAVVLTLAVRADDSGMKERKTTDSSTSSKVYIVYTSQNLGSGGVVVANLTREDFLGIPCLKGTGADGWLKGTNIRIPVDKITGIIECDSFEDWKDKIDQYKQGYEPR